MFFFEKILKHNKKNFTKRLLLKKMSSFTKKIPLTRAQGSSIASIAVGGALLAFHREEVRANMTPKGAAIVGGATLVIGGVACLIYNWVRGGGGAARQFAP